MLSQNLRFDHLITSLIQIKQPLFFLKLDRALEISREKKIRQIFFHLTRLAQILPCLVSLQSLARARRATKYLKTRSRPRIQSSHQILITAVLKLHQGLRCLNQLSIRLNFLQIHQTKSFKLSQAKKVHNIPYLSLKNRQKRLMYLLQIQKRTLKLKRIQKMRSMRRLR